MGPGIIPAFLFGGIGLLAVIAGSPEFLENSEEPRCFSRFDYDYKLLHLLVQLEDAQKKSWEAMEELQGDVRYLQHQLQDETEEKQNLKSRLDEISTSFQAVKEKLTKNPLWGSWSSWGQCFSNCTGDNSGRIQTRTRVSDPWVEGDPEAEIHEETESRPCNAVQFAGCVKSSADIPDNFAVVYDFADQIAQATCTSIASGRGHLRAIRRSCGGNLSCDQVCRNIGESCYNSLHVYSGQPVLERGETEKKGLLVYKYESCSGVYCGPNFCCCRSS